MNYKPDVPEMGKDRWRTIVSVGIILVALSLEFLSFNWVMAKLLVCIGTAVAAGISIIIVDLGLENQNCHASSTVALWRAHAAIKAHVFLAICSVVIIGLGAYIFDHFSGMSVYWPAVIVTIIVSPLIILVMAYLRVSSSLKHC